MTITEAQIAPADSGPEVGDRVFYRLSADDVTNILQAAANAVPAADKWGAPNPYAGHAASWDGIGVGAVIPAVVTRVWSPDTINFHALTDSPGTLWCTARTRGTDPGEWESRP